MGYVCARDIVVEFPIYGGTSRSIKNAVINAATGGKLARDAHDRPVVRALDKVSFEFKEGDRVGLMGHNGAGKSTLLRMLAGAYEPISGYLEVRGKVASMIDVWLGMDSEATGFENIRLRGTILGLRPNQIRAITDEIVEFTQLGDYINMPLRTYSSGMAMRLAFAVSTSVRADIIIMDEWLSAGDQTFSQRAQERLQRLMDQAKIIVLASHDMSLIKRVCNRFMVLSHGGISSVEEVASYETAAN